MDSIKSTWFVLWTAIVVEYCLSAWKVANADTPLIDKNPMPVLLINSGCCVGLNSPGDHCSWSCCTFLIIKLIRIYSSCFANDFAIKLIKIVKRSSNVNIWSLFKRSCTHQPIHVTGKIFTWLQYQVKYLLENSTSKMFTWITIPGKIFTW